MREKLQKIKEDLVRIRKNALKISSEPLDEKMFMILSGLSILELLVDEYIDKTSKKEI